MTDSINYGSLMQTAMHRLIRQVLENVAERGLPGNHHFFISFETTHPGVNMPDWLKERHPAEMMIVLQHWFDALEVSETGFSVKLNFSNTPERLAIPFEAIKVFVDPSVEFGLRFENRTPAADLSPDTVAKTPPLRIEINAASRTVPAKVVQLDQFRKE